MADTEIFITFIVIFVTLGAVLPFVNAAFGSDETDFQANDLAAASGQGATLNSVSIFDVFSSIFLMFVWTFGRIPELLDLIVFVPLRLTFVWLLFRQVRGIGG